MSFQMEVPEYGMFEVNKRSADVELMIAVERDRLLMEYIRRNNSLNPTGMPLTIDDLSSRTTDFYSYFATFSQTAVKTPEGFSVQEFLHEWSRDEWNTFLGEYLKALVQMEASFRKGVADAPESTSVESARATHRTRVATTGTGK
jgi:hypothetical protein